MGKTEVSAEFSEKVWKPALGQFNNPPLQMQNPLILL